MLENLRIACDLVFRRSLRWGLTTFAVGILIVSAAPAAKPDGGEIFRRLCADCHGDQGEGVSGAAENALRGNKSIAELAMTIEATMPEDDPSACQGEEAKAVAQFIHEKFYAGETAPARIELARLTVDQYENTLADLIASFRWVPSPEEERGLKTEVYKKKNFKERAVERIDAKIDFDFGDGVPHEEVKKPEE
ncbi:MAG: c-type cytochrome, partial [Blastopirellula sp. JB062]